MQRCADIQRAYTAMMLSRQYRFSLPLSANQSQISATANVCIRILQLSFWHSITAADKARHEAQPTYPACSQLKNVVLDGAF
jgi:hypothetical protein